MNAKQLKKDLINSLLIKAIRKKKSLKVVQRYLRMRYHIRISQKALDNREQDIKQFGNLNPKLS